MASCWDCIHCGACSDAGDSGFSCLKEDVSKCEHFKNKADYAEVKHGEWTLETDEEMPNPLFKLVICSVCKDKANGTYNFCPHCGAKMDGRRTE